MTKTTIISILGPVITIITLGSTLIYTQGGMAQMLEVTEQNVEENKKTIKTNREKTQNLEVGQERIETKIDGVMDRFDRLETLIMEM